MHPLTQELIAQMEELNDLREFKAAQGEVIASLERKLEAAEKALRLTREKLAKVEARPTVMDGVDEDWLWATNAEIKFKSRFGGGRVLTIDSGKRRAMRTGKDGEPLLKQALEDASGRQRGCATDEAPPRPGKSHRPARA